VFGGIALGVAAIERPARRRLAVAGAAFLGLWLVVGIASLSKMQRFEPRYLEAVDPAIAATLGVGVGWLAGRARHARAAALGLTNVGGQPLLTPAELARLVAAGDVRYVLLSRGTCSPHATRPCAPVLRWALTHSTAVGPAARGVPQGTLYRLSPRAVGA